MIHLDTHVVIWLAERRRSPLSVAARRLLDRHDLQISPMVLMELETLHEAGRLKNQPARVMAAIPREIEVSLSKASFADVIAAARSFAWTRDPFDRLIVANAMADAVQLLTGDEHILRHFKDAVW